MTTHESGGFAASHAAQAGALRELLARATGLPWKVYVKTLTPNALGREHGIKLTTDETCIGTEWVHPQLHGPVPVVTLASGPYHDPSQRVYITPDDAALIVAAVNALPALLAENERLERAILDQQAVLKALETKHDRMQVEYAERGQVNARLNKENARLTKALARTEGPPPATASEGEASPR